MHDPEPFTRQAHSCLTRVTFACGINVLIPLPTMRAEHQLVIHTKPWCHLRPLCMSTNDNYVH